LRRSEFGTKSRAASASIVHVTIPAVKRYKRSNT